MCKTFRAQINVKFNNSFTIDNTVMYACMPEYGTHSNDSGMHCFSGIWSSLDMNLNGKGLRLF